MSDDLAEPYSPVPIYYEEGDYLEYVAKDVPTVVRSVTPAYAVVLDLVTREPIGFRLADWSYLAETIQAAQTNPLARLTTPPASH